jgi:hypothetical protein
MCRFSPLPRTKLAANKEGLAYHMGEYDKGLALKIELGMKASEGRSVCGAPHAAEFTYGICPTCADDTLNQTEPSGLQTRKPQRAPVT